MRAIKSGLARFDHFLRNRWGLIAFLPISLLFGFLLGAPVVFSVAGALITSYAYRVFRTEKGLQEKRVVWLCAVIALLFCLMVPLTWLANRNQLRLVYGKYASIEWVNWIGNLVDNGLTIALTFCFAFSFAVFLWKMTGSFHSMPAVHSQEGRAKGFFDIMLFSAPILLVGGVFLAAYWPGLLTNDSYRQWLMVDGLIPLDDWHPVAHTFLEYLVTRAWHSPAAVAVFQIFAMGLTWGWAMRFFHEQGIPKKWLFLFSCGFALLPFNAILLVTLWKDVLFATASFALLIPLARVWKSDGDWLLSGANQLAFGLTLAIPFLLRHNGILLLLFTPLVLLLLYRSRLKATLTATGIALLLVVGIREVLAFGILKAERNPAAFAYVVPIHHINSVLYFGGEYTLQQKEVLEKIAPIDVWVNNHNEYYADLFTKPSGIMADPQVLEKINLNRRDFLRTFIELSLKYPVKVIRSELRLMSLLWEITEPDGFKASTFDYVLESQPPPSLLSASLFEQPNQNTRLKSMLDGYIEISWINPWTYPLLWRGGIYLFLTIAIAVILWQKTGRKSFILFVPAFSTTLSLMITMPVQNFRYIYPTVISTFFFILCAWTAKPK